MLWFALAAQVVASQPDSAAVLRAARSAQARFEAFRVDHLPYSRGGSYGGPCDDRIGRFCFRFGDDDDDDDWTPPPEPPSIGAARATLVATLDSLHGRSPGDAWIVGQLVRYLIESTKTTQAAAAAGTCRSPAWWCDALMGYAFHAEGHYAAADSAFEAALAGMPESQRCEWTDLSPVLDRLRARYRRLTCAQRAPLERRIWWLADPLYSVPGNERRTEHYARRVMGALQDDARSAYHDRWGSDLDEVVVRYGWPASFERAEPATLGTPEVHITSHYAPHARSFLPPAAYVEAPGTVRPDEWDLDPERPVSDYAPAYAARFHDLPHQVAVFRRGDSIVVVAGYDVRTSADERKRARASTREREMARNVTRVEAALILAKDENARPTIVRGSSEGPEGVMTAIARAESTLLSLETLDTADSVHAARARYWLPVAPLGDAVALSDPLLLRATPGDSVHPALADVLPLVRPVAQARRGERVAVFWETYGLDRSTQPFRVTLTVTQAGQNWLRRAAEWAGLAKRDPRYVALSWEEPLSAMPVTPRAISIAMPDASPGVYLLDVSVAVSGAAVARSSREITILPE